MFSSVLDDSDPSMIYYDLTLSSSVTTDNALHNPPVRFQEYRNQPIISDCSQYFMSIIRFTMDGCGADLPLWIPSIMTDENQQKLPNYTSYDPNKTIYAVTLSGTIGSVSNQTTVYLQWTPEIHGISSGQVRYYYCDSYSHFCDMFNTAVLTAYNSLKAGSLSATTSKPPVLTYDGSSNLFKLYCDASAYGVDRTGSESWSIYMDVNLYQLLNSFHTHYYPNQDPQSYEIVVRNRMSNTVTIGGTAYYAVSQDFPSTDSSWSPVQAITFSTSLLPVIPEQVAQPILLTNANMSGSGSSQPNFQNTITDVALALSRSADYNGFVEYIPNPYRMIPLSDAKQEVRQLDVSVFWKDRTGVLHPLTMSNNATVSIKILFRHKSLGI